MVVIIFSSRDRRWVQKKKKKLLLPLPSLSSLPYSPHPFFSHHSHATRSDARFNVVTYHFPSFPFLSFIPTTTTAGKTIISFPIPLPLLFLLRFPYPPSTHIAKPNYFKRLFFTSLFFLLHFFSSSLPLFSSPLSLPSSFNLLPPTGLIIFYLLSLSSS